MRRLRPSMSPWKSVAFDAFAGVLTAVSAIAVIATTPFWPHGICATGVNDPMQYAVDLVPFGVRCLLVRRLNRGRRQPSSPRGFPVILPENFEACSVAVHLSIAGQIHRQVKDLPPGTKIGKINIVDDPGGGGGRKRPWWTFL